MLRGHQQIPREWLLVYVVFHILLMFLYYYRDVLSNCSYGCRWFVAFSVLVYYALILCCRKGNPRSVTTGDGREASRVGWFTGM